jgi:hypothetical protein
MLRQRDYSYPPVYIYIISLHILQEDGVQSGKGVKALGRTKHAARPPQHHPSNVMYATNRVGVLESKEDT